MTSYLFNSFANITIGLFLFTICVNSIYLKMTNKWSSDTTLKFIREYKAQECLWNTGLPCYLNQDMRAVAYQTLATNMNLPGFDVSQVKKKIRNLRSTYFQERKKMSRLKEQNEHYTSSLKWLGEMEPVARGSYEPRKKPYTYNPKLPDPESPTCIPSESDDEIVPSNANRKRRVDNLDTAINQLLNEPVDDDLIFGQYVASELRQLNQGSSRRKLKRLINDAIAAVAEEDECVDSLPENSLTGLTD